MLYRYLAVLAAFTAVLTSFMFYEDVDTHVESEFSPNLKAWLDSGRYFTYKSEHNIFFVQQALSSVNAHAAASAEEATEPELYSFDSEPTDKSAILFLHGFPTSSYDYIKLWKLFQLNDESSRSLRAKFSSLIAIDYLGFGFSDKPLDYAYSIFDYADMVERLLMHLDVRSVYLVAHDMSDSVALELLRRDNLRTQNHFALVKCVLLNGGIMTSIYKPTLAQDLLRIKHVKDIFARYFFKQLVFKYAFEKVFGHFKPTQTELSDFYMAIRYKQGSRVLPATIEYMGERELYGDVWLDALNDTLLPVTFIYGPADPINPRSRFPQRLRTDTPNVRLQVLSDLVGHYPQWEDSFTVFEIIKQFFS